MKALSTGDVAPDLTLQCTPDQSISLKELRARPVILAFYSADWSPETADADFCAEQGVVCAPSPQQLAEAIATLEGRSHERIL